MLEMWVSSTCGIRLAASLCAVHRAEPVQRLRRRRRPSGSLLRQHPDFTSVDRVHRSAVLRWILVGASLRDAAEDVKSPGT